MKKVVLTTLFIFLATISYATVSVEKLGEWGTGSYIHISTDNSKNIYCITKAAGIDVFDVSNPENMEKIANLPYNNVESIFFEGTTAYLSQGLNGITVVDIQNLQSPITVTTISVDGYVYNCVKNENTLYVASGSKGLTIFDITDINSPVFLTSFTEETDENGETDIIFTKTVKLFYKDNHIYAADKNTGFAIVDVTDISKPKLVESFNRSGGIIDFIMEENRLYLLKTTGFSIVNSEDVSAMTTIAGYSSVKKATGIAKSGDTIFLSDSEYGLTIVDIETEISPTMIKHHYTGGIGSGLVLDDSTVFMSDSFNGLVSIDIADVDNISTIAKTGDCGYTKSVEIKDNYLYVSDYWNGTRIVDKTNLLNPTLLTSIHNGNITNSIKAGEDSYIYTADSDKGVSILDVSNPESVEVVSTVELNGLALSNKLKNNYLFVASEWQGVNIINVEDKENPSLIANYKGQGYIYNVDFYEDTLITASGVAGVEIVDISNPNEPQLLSTLSTNGYAFDVKVKGDFAYVLDFFKGLVVVDISNKDYPVEVATVSEIAYSSNLDIKDNYLFLAQGANGFAIWNIENPYNPEKLISKDTDGYVEYIKAEGSNFYIADGNSGKVLVYSFEDNNTNKLFIPHIALNGWSTYITVENSNEVNENALCKAFVNSTETFKNKVEVQSNEKYTLDITDGKWGVVNTDKGVIGTVTYVQNSTGNQITLPLINSLSTNFTLNIPNKQNTWIGMAIYNQGGSEEVTITLLNNKGETIAQTKQEIGENNNKVWLLSSLFDSDLIDNGSLIKVTGNNLSTGLIISGDEEGNLFGSVAENN